jgi:hypothetical protein
MAKNFIIALRECCRSLADLYKEIFHGIEPVKADEEPELMIHTRRDPAPSEADPIPSVERRTVTEEDKLPV